MPKTLREQLLEHGIAAELKKNAAALDEVSQARKALEALLDRARRRGNIDREQLNAAIDNASALGVRLLPTVDIDFLHDTFLHWSRAAKHENPSKYLRRLFVVAQNQVAASLFLNLIAERFVRSRHGEIASDRWTRLAERMQSSDNFLERIKGAEAPYDRAAAERQRAEQAEQHQVEIIKTERDRFEREIRERAARALDLLCSDFVRIRVESPPVSFRSPMLSAEDAKLCCTWAGLSSWQKEEIDDHGTLASAVGEYEATRLASARSAEHVAAKYYGQLGALVYDTSVEQLTGISLDWKTHDLNVDGWCVDVKNARRSFASPNSYSEHCVSKLKTSIRGSVSSDVLIAGTLSDYVPIGRYSESAQDSETTVLGEVSREALKRAAQWASDRTDSRLKIVDVDQPNFFPGWVFEYPDRHYAVRAEAIRSWPAKIRNAMNDGVLPQQIPLSMLACIDHNDLGYNLEIDDKRAAVLQDVRALDGALGLTRLSAVVFVLSEFVRAAAGVTGEFDLANIQECIFPEHPRFGMMADMPFARVDVEQFVYSMLDALHGAWSHARTRLTQFRRFQLAGVNILRGEDGDGRWKTILAYCGGFRVVPPLVRCGKSPLILGTSELCEECLRLVCPGCQYCSAECSSGKARRIKLKEQAASSA